jgi:hypothetical protein
MKTISVQQNESRAVSKYIRMSPSKIRRVLRQIQGKNYKDALIILEFLPYASCEPIIKVLRSAAANAKHNKGFDESKLIVKAACRPGADNETFSTSGARTSLPYFKSYFSHYYYCGCIAILKFYNFLQKVSICGTKDTSNWF